MTPDTIDRALRLFGLRALGEAEPVANSVRNQNYRVLTGNGPVFLRFHRRNRPLARLRREHRVIEWAAGQGVPVARPQPSTSGDTLQELDGQFVAVFPWLAGHSLQRGCITAAEAGAMGEMHGRLHSALAAYDDADLPWIWGAWEPRALSALDELARCEAELANLDLAPDQRAIIGECLGAHRERLLAEGETMCPAPDAAGGQPVHGDYHERNVLLEGNQIVAVVDWDMVTRMPRGFELVRCLAFAGLLEQEQLEPYLRAYGDRVTLAPTECVEAVELWWRYTLRDTWLYRTRLFERDAALQPFFAEHIDLLTRLGDRSYRAHLAGELRRLAGRGS